MCDNTQGDNGAVVDLICQHQMVTVKLKTVPKEMSLYVKWYIYVHIVTCRPIAKEQLCKEVTTQHLSLGNSSVDIFS